MLVLETTNVHEVLPAAVDVLLQYGERRESRAGEVYVYPTPVTTLYRFPRQKVMFWERRDANPFFHFFESLWLLAGRDDAAWLCQFNKNIGQFAQPDTGRFHGAYGKRWREWFGFDQLRTLIENLRANPNCRRQMLTVWDPREDLVLHDRAAEIRDIPCNTQAHFQVNSSGEVDMTVFCRSNDVVWGCYGSDAVNFAFLLEYVAGMAGYEVGRYWQVSDNWHGYVKTLEPLRHLSDDCDLETPYRTGEVEPLWLVKKPDAWNSDLQMFVDEGELATGYRDPFFRGTALPMLRSWRAFKSDARDRHDRAISIALKEIAASDWRKACAEWLERRKTRWLARRS